MTSTFRMLTPALRGSISPFIDVYFNSDLIINNIRQMGQFMRESASHAFQYAIIVIYPT